MPKPITAEMLHAMTLDQRKILHHNALGRDTPTAHAILELLSQDDLLSRPKTATATTPRKKSAASTGPKKVKAEKADKAVKPIKAVHGRQA